MCVWVVQWASTSFQALSSVLFSISLSLYLNPPSRHKHFSFHRRSPLSQQSDTWQMSLSPQPRYWPHYVCHCHANQQSYISFWSLWPNTDNTQRHTISELLMPFWFPFNLYYFHDFDDDDHDILMMLLNVDVAVSHLMFFNVCPYITVPYTILSKFVCVRVFVSVCHPSSSPFVFNIIISALWYYLWQKVRKYILVVGISAA